MSKHARLSVEDHAAGQQRVRARLRTRYYAFLSYSHQDEELADWLHRELEKFRVPHALAGRLTEHGAIPRRLTPIFRDQHELSAADDLADGIEAALASSQFLVVLCSPAAAASRWTNAEIEAFKRTRPEGCVLAAIASGEPFASDMPGREAEECFPPALRYRYDRRGRSTSKRAEPLAADLRGGHDGQRTGLLKLIAGMLGVGLDELVQRETTRRHRQLGWLAAASLAGMAVTSTLAVAAFHARNEAREQRREAEGLVGFMLGDLKDKLEPIGRLDALDGVGARVLDYYRKQDKSELSDAALSQRSKALSLMGQVAGLRGDAGQSERLYREAMGGTSEAIRRNPNDTQALYEHAQNVFQIGELARDRGDFGAAEAAYREYKRLADRMVALQPDNLKWRVEAEDAEANLGIVFFNQRRFIEADRQFQTALSTIDAVVAVDPSKADYQEALSETLGWLGDAKLASGDLGGAQQARVRQIALLERMIARSSGNVNYRSKIIVAYQSLGRIILARGNPTAAVPVLRRAVDEADRLLPGEPDNMRWQGFAAAAKLSLADAMLTSNDLGGAADQIQQGCRGIQQVIARDRSVLPWRNSLRACFSVRAELALRKHLDEETVESARQALKLVGFDHSIQAAAELARLHRLTGDAYSRMGRQPEARSEWSASLAALPPDAKSRPAEMAERAAALRRLGQSAEADRIKSDLTAIGYRRTV
jgi:tetratricopeptide (TPR) repeat protein